VTTQAEVDRLAREVAELRQAVLQRRYGMRADQLILVLGGQDAALVVEQRLASVPPELRRKIKPRVLELPFITHRQVQGATHA